MKAVYFADYFQKDVVLLWTPADIQRILCVDNVYTIVACNKVNKMANKTMVHARVDAETKSKAQSVLNKLGMTLSEAIVLYLKQIAFHSGIPFEVKIPNELTMRTIEKSERGEELHEASSVDEMFKELNS